MSGRIVVLISGSGSNMDALADACERDEIPGHIVAVFADRDCGGIELARERGIEAEVVEPKQYLDRADWCEALAKRVESHDPDLVVSAGFMRILTPSFVDAFEGRLINLHPSLLPDFPGAHAVRDALEAGVDLTGTTVHFVDREVDHGPVIAQERVRIEPGDTEESLHERIKAVEHRVLPRVVGELLTRMRP
ncbi:MAG: phosphoribosylglycinamide formyltransferase [Actinomycetota bacterium]